VSIVAIRLYKRSRTDIRLKEYYKSACDRSYVVYDKYLEKRRRSVADRFFDRGLLLRSGKVYKAPMNMDSYFTLQHHF
jgi:hypothetical protein